MKKVTVVFKDMNPVYNNHSLVGRRDNEKMPNMKITKKVNMMKKKANKKEN
jgi:hypothetical protein